MSQQTQHAVRRTGGEHPESAAGAIRNGHAAGRRAPVATTSGAR
ncbi:hypothetical protein F4562_002956 [Streptosporangium becharense]|uniref:Uncharacterized protein n=1 Tax=Streptosporangium becharense TaxID=1816182 RepID=A0A7W9IH00_9ACTN|nr:hypothetical protein [Streptosporangium becharense]MBB5819894.1 hypothetical protein [Streptosporangium becharense]